MYKIFLVVLVLISSLFQDTWDITSWKTSTIPAKIGHTFLPDINYQVYEDKDKVMVKYRNRKFESFRGEVPSFNPSPPVSLFELKMYGRGTVTTLKVKNGWLIAFDHGEWGSQFCWFNNTGKESYSISGVGHVAGFIQIKDKIYVVPEWGGFSFSGDPIVEILFKDGKWVSEVFVRLLDRPFVFTLLPNNNLLVVTDQELVQITPDKNIISTYYGLGYLSPNSVVVRGENIYMGMWTGVLKTTFKIPGTQQWLVPE